MGVLIISNSNQLSFVVADDIVVAVFIYPGDVPGPDVKKDQTFSLSSCITPIKLVAKLWMVSEEDNDGAVVDWYNPTIVRVPPSAYVVVSAIPKEIIRRNPALINIGGNKLLPIHPESAPSAIVVGVEVTRYFFV